MIRTWVIIKVVFINNVQFFILGFKEYPAHMGEEQSLARSIPIKG